MNLFKAGYPIFLLILLIITWQGIGCCEELPKKITLEHEESKEILLNPGMGFYVAGWNHTRKDDLPPYTNLVYNRFMWKDLEPEKGVLKLDKVKEFISYWKNNDCRVAFRIISSNIRGTQTPEYVFNQGVPGVVHNPENGTQKDPVYWDSQYLELYADFIQSIGEALNGGEGIEFLDMGGIGIFGEMHLGLHIPGMWTEGELRTYRFSEDVFFTAYQRMITAYKKAFPKTRLFLNISRYDQIAEYAAKQGIGLRYDGLSLKFNPTLSSVSNIFNKFAANRSKEQTGVPVMYEFANNETELEKIEKCLKIAFSDPISYMHINLGKSSFLDKSISEIIKRYAIMIGYRIYLKSTMVPEISFSNSTIPIKQIWENKGTANPYKDFIFRISIFGGETEVYSQNVIQSLGTSLWQPGQEVIVTSNLQLPYDLPDGDYHVTMSAIEPNSSIDIQLANNKNFNEGVINLFSIKIEAGKAYVYN